MIIAVFDISVAFFHGKMRKMIYVVPPEDHRKKVKSLHGTRDASQVFAKYVEVGLNDHGFQRKCGGAVFVLGRNAGSTWCALVDMISSSAFQKTGRTISNN